MNDESIGYLGALLLGVVQGLTEFLPVSSSGHLALSRHLFGIDMKNAITFDLLLHLATVLVVIRFFWNDIRGLWGRDRVVVGYLVVATIPAGIIGILLRDVFENIEKSPLALGGALMCTAGFLWLSERYTESKHSIRTMGLHNAFIIGMAQALAVTPGISRSGLTLTGGIICGVAREDAFRFSFLMMVPVVTGAAFLDILKHHDEITTIVNGPLALGFLAAMVTGHFALQLLQKVVLGRRLRVCSVYCLVIGLVAVVTSLVF